MGEFPRCFKLNAEDYRGLNKVMHEMDQAEGEGFVAVTTPEILLFEKSVWARPWNYLVIDDFETYSPKGACGGYDHNSPAVRLYECHGRAFA